MTHAESGDKPKAGDRPPPDYSAESWQHRRAIGLWDGLGDSGWAVCCRQARAEYRLAQWLAMVFCGGANC